MNAADFIEAARVPRPFRPWDNFPLNAIQRTLPEPDSGYTDYVVLSEVNMAGLHKVRSDDYGGDIVMEDSPRELRKHLPILFAAHGRILKTGLGLGCVVRGLLSKSEVEHIDVIEINASIIERFGAEFRDNPRVTIHHGDALGIELPGYWDFAWHDIYCEGNDGLQLLHARLMNKWWPQTGNQGAWAFPREMSKMLPFRLVGAPKRSCG